MIYVEPIEVIAAHIKALPPITYPDIDTPTHALARFIDDVAFDAVAWDRQWAAVENEIKAMSRADRLADDRELVEGE